MNDLNNRGQYVGYLIDDGDSVLRGFVMRNGRVTSFDAPGAEITSAYDINDRGQIVGAGFPFPIGPLTGASEPNLVSQYTALPVG